VAIVSMASRIFVTQHGSSQYVDPMMRSTCYWAMMASLAAGGFAVCRRSRVNAYVILIAIVAVATYASGLAVQDYLQWVKTHHSTDWREFGTSTPDYFAGYLLITIPITLALFLNAPAGLGKRVSWLFALALVLELASLPITGSRFALISLVVLAVVFAVGLAVAAKGGFELSKPFRTRLVTLAVIAVLAGGAFAGPMLHRLGSGTMASQANSGAFRVYTWRGALRMAAQFPLLGAGPGMFIYIYPQYANVGFTRETHSGYLQVLDDLGPIGEICVLMIVGGCLWAGASALRAPKSATEASPESPLLEQVAHSTTDDRIVIVGLISGVVGALVQNSIDSDWMVTLCGVTLFLAAGALLGLAAARSTEPTEPSRALSPIRTSSAAAAALLALACLTWSFAGFAEESQDYIGAASIEPMNPDYVSNLAWKVNFAARDLTGCERNLTTAIALAPDPVTYHRRAELYDFTHRPQLALADITSGLQCDPNSLELLLLGGQISDEVHNHPAALGYYSRMTQLQTAPYGLIPAIGEVVEFRYAFADAVMGADALGAGRPKDAIVYLTRSQIILQTYADEGGSSNEMRQALTGGKPDPEIDRQLQDLYNQVMTALIGIYQTQADLTSAASARSVYQAYKQKYIRIVGLSSPKV
jgi:O-antigen ligase